MDALKLYLAMGLMSLFSGLLLALLMLFKGEPLQPSYILNVDPGKEINAQVTRDIFGKYIVKEIEGDYKEILTGKELFNKYVLRVKPPQKFTERYGFRSTLVFVVSISLIFLLIWYLKFRRNRKIVRLLVR